MLSIAGASDEDREILGAAAGLFVLLGVLVWWRRSRLLWGAIAAVQVLMGRMYFAIAPERDPSFEVWGITIRLLSFGLLVVVTKLWLDTPLFLAHQAAASARGRHDPARPSAVELRSLRSQAKVRDRPTYVVLRLRVG